MNIRFYGDSTDIPIGESAIFLAGPTKRGGDVKDSWRTRAIKIFSEINYKGILFIPENGCIWSDGSINGTNNNSDYDEACTIWERKALSKVDCIMFWIPRKRDLPGFTTNIEFGEWSARKPNQIILGHPKNSRGNGYIDYLYNQICGRGQYLETLEDTVSWSVEVAKTFWKIRNASDAYKNALGDMERCSHMF